MDESLKAVVGLCGPCDCPCADEVRTATATTASKPTTSVRMFPPSPAECECEVEAAPKKRRYDPPVGVRLSSFGNRGDVANICPIRQLNLFASEWAAGAGVFAPLRICVGCSCFRVLVREVGTPRTIASLLGSLCAHSPATLWATGSARTDSRYFVGDAKSCVARSPQCRSRTIVVCLMRGGFQRGKTDFARPPACGEGKILSRLVATQWRAYFLVVNRCASIRRMPDPWSDHLKYG
jgi:hypothetical protein